MTKEVKKSLQSAAGVLICLGALGLGATWRDRVDLAQDAGSLNTSNLLASTATTADLPETKFFEDIMELLKQKYVEPITDEMKLADGAVRGMVASLGDPNSLYMDADQFRVYSNARLGKFEGIGASLILATDKSDGKVQVGGEAEAIDDDRKLPKLVVAAVVPGSSAERAGLRPGDWVEYVEDHWVPNSEALEEFEALGRRVKEKKASAEEYLKMRKKLREAADKNILPIRARDRLMMGASGSVATTWVRAGKRLPVTLEKGEWEMPGFGVLQDGSIRLPFLPGSADKLREAIAGKDQITIDLRNNVDGDFDAMIASMKVLAPAGDYGFLITHKTEKPLPLRLVDGAEKPVRVTLLVDRTTRGAAEIFATALEAKGFAKVSGDNMGGEPYVVRWNKLPSGAGYTLVTSEYRAKAPKGILATTDPHTAKHGAGK